jgi:hypothetical protein
MSEDVAATPGTCDILRPHGVPKSLVPTLLGATLADTARDYEMVIVDLGGASFGVPTEYDRRLARLAAYIRLLEADVQATIRPSKMPITKESLLSN